MQPSQIRSKHKTNLLVQSASQGLVAEWLQKLRKLLLERPDKDLEEGSRL